MAGAGVSCKKKSFYSQGMHRQKNTNRGKKCVPENGKGLYV